MPTAALPSIHRFLYVTIMAVLLFDPRVSGTNVSGLLLECNETKRHLVENGAGRHDSRGARGSGKNQYRVTAAGAECPRTSRPDSSLVCSR